MNPTRLDEHEAACRLLHSYGDIADRRGSPVWLLLRSLSPRPPEADPQGADGLDTCEIDDPAGLLGYLAGPDWDAVAVVGTGRFRLLDEAHEPPAALVPGIAGGLAMACLVTRRGQVGWRMRLPDGTYYERVPESGFMLDILRRSLQLQTPPPEFSTSPLELSAWVAALVGAAGEAGRRLGWTEALELHPLVSDGPVWGPPEDVEAKILASATTDDWETMRRMVAAGLHADIAPPPRLAAWMDEGMFSRWVLRDVPDRDCILAVARPHLHPGAYRRFCHLVRALDHRSGVTGK